MDGDACFVFSAQKQFRIAPGKNNARLRIVVGKLQADNKALGSFVEAEGAAGLRNLRRNRTTQDDNAIGRAVSGVPCGKAILERPKQSVAEGGEACDRKQQDAGCDKP